MSLDHTHEPDLISWVESARDHADFPVQNLPFGVMDFGDGPRPVVAIGDEAFDLKVATQQGLLGESGELNCAAAAPSLNALANLGADVRRELRRRISALLTGSDPSLHDDTQARTEVLRPQSEGTMLAPFAIGDYTDFYCSIHHATNVGSMFRPDNPLMPNYRHLPVGYHGRASTVVLEGGEVRRPSGQTLPVEANDPIDGPSRLLDYEFELGFYVGEGNAMGSRINMVSAPQHIFGLSIVNDWSARDIQKWEYQPLGPFNAKNFCTQVSPWVVTMEALEPFRVAGPARGPEDPENLPYLHPDRPDQSLGIVCETAIRTVAMRERGEDPFVISTGDFRHMHWTIEQMLVHHTSSGCAMRSGDLIASGTVSGPEPESRGCLLERTWRGSEPIQLPDGTERKFLQDGDEIIMRAWCEMPGAVRIGLGRCAGTITPAE